MKLQDKTRKIEITMKQWEGMYWSKDQSNEIFALPEEAEVEDLDYCIEYAEDWKNRRNDFSEDAEDENQAERAVWIKEL